MLRITKYFARFIISSIRVYYLKIRGAHIGKRVLIGHAKFKTNPKNIWIGDGVVIGNSVIFDKLKSIEIKDYVKIHNGVHVQNGTGGKARFYIGYNSWVGNETILNCERDITIESNACIGYRSQLWTHGYFPAIADGYPSKIGTIIIKKGAWICSTCILLPDVKIGKHSIIGTGSVVTKNIPDRVLATGIPCKIKSAEATYKKILSREEKIDATLKGCINNIELNGGKTEQLDDHSWLCTILFKEFRLIFQQKPENHQGKKATCIFTWEEPKQLVNIPKNTSLFILKNNTYTKKSTLHEWVVIRALLDSCTLRLRPIINNR